MPVVHYEAGAEGPFCGTQGAMTTSAFRPHVTCKRCLRQPMADKAPVKTTIRRLAAEIQERWPELRVEVESAEYNTDRHYGRIRWPGKGRRGTRIRVYRPWTAKEKRERSRFSPGELLLDHNNAATYRRTEDVREWMERYAATRVPLEPGQVPRRV